MATLLPPFLRAAGWRLFLAGLSAGGSGAADAGEVVALSPYATESTGVKIPRPGEDITGLAGGWQAIPRVLALAGSERLQDWSLRRVEDLSLLVPGAVAAPPYGVTGVPAVRAELGDAAQNGQRRAYNRNVFPVSFNGVEAVEILAGAPPVSLGPAAGTGGLVNFVAKRPLSGPAQGRLGVTMGAWGERRLQLDVSAPLSPGWASRLSVERVDAGSFYRLVGEESWNAFLALSWEPAAGTRWDLSVESYRVRFLENPGTNRPTQALIDRGEYLTGSSVQLGGGGSYFGNTFTPAGVVRIDGSQVLAAPGDGAWARTLTAQLTGAWRGAGGRRFTSRTYFEDVAGEKYAAYHFYSYVPRSRTFEQRLEVGEERRVGAVDHALRWGGAVRGEERESYVDFLNEAMNAFDLTLDPATYRFPPERFFAVRPVPGRPGRVAVPGGRYGVPRSTGISQTLRSRLANLGVFVQDEMTLPAGWSLVLGWRGDALAVQAEDPLAPPGVAPARDGMTKFVQAGTASLLWKRDAVVIYATFNHAAAVESSSSSGGFGLNNNRLADELFSNRSVLAEVGVKAATADGRATAGVAVYDQRRHRTNARAGLPDEIAVRGLELTGEWRPARGWEIAANAGLLDARYVDGPVPGSIATVPGFAPDVPSPNFRAFARGGHRLPGQPRQLANVMVRFEPGRGWAVRTWATWRGPQNLDLFGRVVLPAQHTWNVGVTWRRGDWELRGDVLNVTGEFNWRPTSTPFAGGDLVTRELPRHWRVTLSREF